MRNSPFASVPRPAAAWCAIAALALVGWAVRAGASELRPTKDFADVAAAVNRAIDQYGAEHVLLVLDIDNTIMAMDQDLGSDHWFEWQSYLLQHEPDSPYLVAKDFAGLLEAQGIIYNLGTMHPPEAAQPALIAELQKRGVGTIILTSRGPEYRVATERELKRCGYDIGATALEVEGLAGGSYLPYDPANPARDGLTAEELKVFKLSEPRPVTYEHGVFMTAGQHKGIMLLALLHHAKRDIKAVVYVDDNVRHVGAVFSAATDRKLDIASFQYQHEDVRVQRFQYGDKADVTNRWRQLAASIDKTFKQPTAAAPLEPAHVETAAAPLPVVKRAAPCGPQRCCPPAPRRFRLLRAR